MTFSLSSATLEDMYDELKFMAKANFGAVLQGKDRSSGTNVAIKCCCMQNNANVNINREIRINHHLKDCEHENIVKYDNFLIQELDHIRDDEIKSLLKLKMMDSRSNLLLCIAMAKCEASLRNHLDSVNREFFASQAVFSLEDTIAFMKASGRKIIRDGREFPSHVQAEQAIVISDICHGLQYLHEKNIAHRDLKPQNILYIVDASNRKTFKIADFGMSKIIDISEPMSKNGIFFYSAPEQLTNEIAGKSADIFSLGILFIEILYPFTDQRDKTTSFIRSGRKRKKINGNAILGDFPPEFRLVHPKISTVVREMMNPERGMRPKIAQVIQVITKANRHQL